MTDNHLESTAVFREVESCDSVSLARSLIGSKLRRIAVGYISAGLVRDLFYANYLDASVEDTRGAYKLRSEPSFPDLDVTDSSRFSENFKRYFEGRLSEEDTSKASLTLARLGVEFKQHKLENRRQWISTNVGLRENRLAFRMLIVYAQSLGITFVTCYDGFDYIQAADFAMGSKKSIVFDELADWLSETRGDFRIRDLAAVVNPVVMVTVRHCTLAILQSRNDTVCSPSAPMAQNWGCRLRSGLVSS